MESIKNIKLDNLVISNSKIGSLSKPIFALTVNVFDFSKSSHIVKDFYNSENIEDIVKSANAVDCDILNLKFNLEETPSLNDDIEKSKKLLKTLLKYITKPLMIQGANNKEVDTLLLPALIEELDREAIIAFVDENTYKSIVPSVIKGNHILVIRTPIDINLAKEMNILVKDIGMDINKILIDTDMGGLGYGLEYGYSIIERIKLAAQSGDEMLNMPLIAFAGDEALKAKETKSDSYDKNYGDFKERSMMFEITTASSICAAGANIVVVHYPNTISTLKSVI